MEKIKKLLLLSSIFIIIYSIFEFVMIPRINGRGLSSIDIIILTIGLVLSLYFIYLSLSKNTDLSKHRVFIFIVSLIFFLLNIVSGVIGFIAFSKINKKPKRELPKLEVINTYKPYVYIIVFGLCMFIMFFLSNYFTNNIEVYLSYIFMFTLNIFIFRKELKRDFKYFKEYFREYSIEVFKTYLKALVIIIVLSLSIKLYTGIQNPTNQESIIEILRIKVIATSILAIIYAPIVEEILFRGYFRKIINNKTAFIIISGIMFGAAHVVDDFKSIEELLYILLYSSLGCVLASLYYKTNNIFTNIYLHFIQNSISIFAILILAFFPGIA